MSKAIINTVKSVFHMMRQEYRFPAFERKNLHDNPWETFNEWFQQASKIETNTNAMSLSTVNDEGRPSSRIVLLKEISEGGLVFFSNYESRKILEIAKNPYAALLFYWEKQQRQVRFEGYCHKISVTASQEYFATRPYASQIAAWASSQSQPLESREVLDKRFKAFSKRYPKGLVPCPPHWGGYRLMPTRIEFWQGRINRLHDRFVYQKKTIDDTQSAWDIIRVNP